jgi:hypothetical protein
MGRKSIVSLAAAALIAIPCLSAISTAAMADGPEVDRPQLHCQNHSVLWSVEHGDREQKITCTRK